MGGVSNGVPSQIPRACVIN